ncbi:hypothetical protein PR048_013970 [Dryococelus australis]|uniref:Uncharacterized protein n=1 Tax=Dryococelus australis TaxID=614101 RepID=A0ABQ9HU63_9NEOP|nr:hypothetical protein PR048_013970 [Dryococelus australis]
MNALRFYCFFAKGIESIILITSNVEGVRVKLFEMQKRVGQFSEQPRVCKDFFSNIVRFEI